MMRIGLRAGCFALLVFSTPAAAQRSSRRVMRAADIAAAGWHRLGDVVSALPPGSTASIDGFNHQLTSSNVPFSGLQQSGTQQSTTVPSWSVRLDGQRIPVAIDGMWILDALPVAMTQIDSVVITTGPRIVDGHVTLLGTIDLFTRRPVNGPSAIGDYQHGDESGDPGPYRYTARGNPNVEKLGPFASGAVAFGRPRWSLDGAARYSSLNITDPNITDRYPTSFPQLQSDVNASGGSGVLTTSFAGSTQQTIGGRGRFTGLLWVPSLKREESVRVIASHAGSSGAMSFERASLRYGLTGTALDVRELGSLTFSIGHTRTMVDVFVEVTAQELPFAVGAGVTAWRMERAGFTDTRPAERLWLAYDAHGATASLAAEHGASGSSVSGTATYERRLRDSQVVSFSASVLRTMGDADGAWIDRFGGIEPPARPVTMGELRAEMTAEENSFLIPTVYARVLMISGLRQVSFRIEEAADLGLVGGLLLSTPNGKRVAGFLRGEIGGQGGFVDPGEESTPASFVEANVSTVAAGNFHLAASARYAANTSWPSLQTGARLDLPAMRRVDVSANKPFWHDRIRAQLVIRNLLDTDEIYHPLGAQWNLRTHLALTMALPPYPSSRVGATR